MRPLLLQVDLQPASLKVGGGVGADDQTEAVSRSFEILYLDESARVVRFLPDADSDSDPQLFVFERDSAEQYEEEVCLENFALSSRMPPSRKHASSHHCCRMAVVHHHVYAAS